LVNTFGVTRILMLLDKVLLGFVTLRVSIFKGNHFMTCPIELILLVPARILGSGASLIVELDLVLQVILLVIVNFYLGFFGVIFASRYHFYVFLMDVV